VTELNRRSACASLTAAFPVALVAWSVIRAPRLGLDESRLAELSPGARAARQRREELDRRDRATVSRLWAKKELGAGLAEGRLALLEAAARVRELDRQSPDFHWERFRAFYPGASDEERHCREAIGWARTALHAEPSRCREVTERLGGELRRHLDAGTLRLPEPDGSLALPRG